MPRARRSTSARMGAGANGAVASMVSSSPLPPLSMSRSWPVQVEMASIRAISDVRAALPPNTDGRARATPPASNGSHRLAGGEDDHQRHADAGDELQQPPVLSRAARGDEGPQVAALGPP